MRGGCHRAAGLLIAVALAAIATGCGGSSAPTKATYGKNVDKLCNTLDDRVSAIQKQAPTTTDELVQFADDLEKVIEDGVNQLDDVERPDGDDGKKAEAWIKELTKQKDEAIKPALEELKTAAQKKDTAAIQRAVQRIQQVDEKKVNQLAREAGARSCGDQS
jgi:GTP1/Obg family GTP-binding protein